MKATFAVLLSAGLALAQSGLSNSTNVNSSGVTNIGLNGGSDFNLADFDLGDLNLGDLDVGGLNLGKVDLGDQDAIAEAILAMLGNLCLGGALDLNKILSFGFNNDVDLFFQLAQLQQLEHLGFLNLGGIHSLFNKGLVLGGFNIGECKPSLPPVGLVLTVLLCRPLQASDCRGQEDHEADQAAARPQDQAAVLYHNYRGRGGRG